MSVSLSIAVAQQLAAPAAADKYKPTEIQLLKLQNKQKDALLAKAAMDSAQARFQQSVLDLTNEAEKIKLENKWAKEVQFDPNLVTFSDPPAKKDDPKDKVKP